MGQRGPKPGQYKMRPVPAGSPLAAKPSGAKYTPGEPDRPPHLGERAAAVWDRTAAEMDRAGALTHADRDILAAYCVAVADLESLSERIDRDGLLVEAPVYARYGDKVGTVLKPHPGLKWRQDLMSKVQRLAAELGLTPAARAKAGPVADAPTATTNPVLAIRDRIRAARGETA